ncbi:hypothetical protein CKO23_13245 [Thiocystis violacea]|nr:hypothetical protein [Thiocystis violacea]
MRPRSSRPLRARLLLCCAAALVMAGCASSARSLMPTPSIYAAHPESAPFGEVAADLRRTNVDLLYVTDRLPDLAKEAVLPYGEVRSRSIGFGSAIVEMTPVADWATLERQSLLAQRTQDIHLELGAVKELGRFPTEPYDIERTAAGKTVRTPGVVARHALAKAHFQGELRRRLKNAPSKQVMLYVHGFNETFATASYTAAELCHFFAHRHVCGFFTWPASSSGSFLISYTNTTESAEYSVGHLKKAIRLIAQTPGVEGLQLLAHSRGTAVLLGALRELAIESIAAGIEPAKSLKIENVVLMSPDIDVDVATQKVEAFGSDPDLIAAWDTEFVPNLLRGRLTIYASPEDRALRLSQFLFRSRNRVGQLRPEDITPAAQAYFSKWGDMDLIVYDGERTDIFGHSYFTSNPEVSSDLIELVRFGRAPGEPGRPLVQTGPITWEFPKGATQTAGGR